MRITYHLLVWLLLIGLLSWSCESGSTWQGLYTGQLIEEPAGTVTLILQNGGKGQWMADQESTPLRWEERSGSLLLHLKNGGIIIAKTIPSENALLLELPGIGSLIVKKTSQ